MGTARRRGYNEDIMKCIGSQHFKGMRRLWTLKDVGNWLFIRQHERARFTCRDDCLNKRPTMTLNGGGHLLVGNDVILTARP